MKKDLLNFAIWVVFILLTITIVAIIFAIYCMIILHVKE